ncbi:MAG: hypothetical protein MMC33_007808 [Icmadophila ericetorum]|nr:hypothetical protein [Icmadophila ericetorum]
MSTINFSNSKPTLAIFGSTGGVCSTILKSALKAGYHCSALVRTPSKLTTILEDAGLSSSLLTSNLTIHTGDVKDPVAVRAALLVNSSPADIIISGVGFFVGTSDIDIHLCESAARTVVSAVQESKYLEDKKPLMVVISTTGISAGPRDVPILFLPLYKVLIRTPHADKKAMEDVVVEAATQAAIGGYVIVRPSLFKMWGDEGRSEKGGNKPVRVGREKKPAVGYLIGREDVANWVFEECVVKGGEGWRGERVSLTW